MNRVCWLRAKALLARWQEELTLVRYEMRWTINWFNYRETHCADRGRAQKGEGEKCYSFRQAAMWHELAEKAERAFQEHMQKV